MAELYSEGRPATQETAEEIINRLEKSNYIPASYLVHKEYASILLKEYTEYRESQSKKTDRIINRFEKLHDRAVRKSFCDQN